MGLTLRMHLKTSMLKPLSAIVAGLLLSWTAFADVLPVRATLVTDLGDIEIELYPDKAPATVANFITYAEQGFYNGTIFHRIKPGFVVQGGGYTFDFVKKETRDPVVNESNNHLKNRKGTLAMARLADPDSATSQFFINLGNNRHLDADRDDPGYTVFGQVMDGMSVVDAIADEPLGLYKAFPDAPNTPVRILQVRLLPPASTNP